MFIMDTAFFFGYLPEQEIRNFILNHREDRVLFGTDFPIVDQAKDLDYLRKLDLPEGLKERILYLNAKELLRI
jgi:Predicted metal-dependent hydrolase of the TIM-barrel fold